MKLFAAAQPSGPLTKARAAGEDPDRAEDRAVALLQRAKVPSPLSSARLARLAAAASQRAQRDHRRERQVFAGAVASLAVFAGAFALAGGRRESPKLGRSGGAPSAQPPAAASDSLAQPVERPLVQRLPGAPVVSPAADGAIAHSGALPAHRPPSPRPARSAQPSLPPAPEDTLNQESSLLLSALAALQPDPELAIRLTDRYRQQFPAGRLAGEAQLVRVRALLSTQRDTEALALLDELDGEKYRGFPEADVLELTRAELLAAGGRCAEALRVFSRLQADPRTSLAERARRGFQNCQPVAVGD